MSEFHVVLQASELPDSKFAISFEEATEAFEQLPRMFLEPDGSFVWVVEDAGAKYQLDGLLTDDGTNLLHCELKGTCNAAVLDQFLTALGWPDQSLVFQVVRQGSYLNEAEFRAKFIR